MSLDCCIVDGCFSAVAQRGRPDDPSVSARRRKGVEHRLQIDPVSLRPTNNAIAATLKAPHNTPAAASDVGINPSNKREASNIITSTDDPDIESVLHLESDKTLYLS